MTMIGEDWVGPITPACSATGFKYVFLLVGYFTRFVWAKAYLLHRAFETIDLLRDHVAPVFGWPKGVYTDNGPHFINDDLTAVFQKHGVSHFTRPISHPRSTGLLERVVQEMLSLISKSCIDRGTASSWSLLIREHILTMNTKVAKVNGFAPSQIMLGFEPQQYHFDIKSVAIPDLDDAEQELPAHQYQIFTALRDENRLLASENAIYSHGYRKARERKQRIPEPGDLVLVRNHPVDKSHSGKLDPRWLGPRIFEEWTCHSRSGWVRQIHGSQKRKRYSINDIVAYYSVPKTN